MDSASRNEPRRIAQIIKGLPILRFSTSTLSAGNEVVPWLAANGELAYSPHSPPERDYFFQYSWVVPGVLREGANKRRHYWFGAPSKDDPNVRLLFRFWNAARQGAHHPLFLSNGVAGTEADVTAPVAVYRHAGVHRSGHASEGLIMMQHGSYHIGNIDTQPRIEHGEVVLYRRVQTAEIFVLQRLTMAETRRRVMDVHARSLTDSVVSFNAAHCNLMRCETGYLKDGSFLFDGLCREAGLDPAAPALRSTFYSGYALEEWCASRKFGPNYVKFRTPLTNIRINDFRGQRDRGQGDRSEQA